ncbi:unannotated protein [freshwater metagenome]|uniref:Unannotated protein n=1 Tax=freshwater metagenome TaxID=449393 RepID=A0A6J7IHX6_9ZZZZ|nr:hypothetical protein [Actinomycetota bacterium]
MRVVSYARRDVEAGILPLLRERVSGGDTDRRAVEVPRAVGFDVVLAGGGRRGSASDPHVAFTRHARRTA